MRESITSPSFFIGRGDGDLISFGSGQPDMSPPAGAYGVLNDYREFKYGLIQGEEALREALAREYPEAKPEQFVITNGASEAIDLALRVISKPEGKVLLPRPYYYSYPSNVIYAGMTPVYYDLDENGKIDFESFKKLVPESDAVLINSPSNPTGTVQEIPTLQKVEQLCDKLEKYIISDEVYKDLVYTRSNYLLKGKKVLTVNSFSKTYAMCGLRIGYLYSRNKDVVDGVIEMKTHTSMNTSIVGQAMALAAMRERESYVAPQVAIWKERRDLMYDGMRSLGLDLYKPEGAFYVLPKFKEPTRAMHDLYYNYRMITYDGNWFGAPERLRFSYALEAAKIKEGLRRLGEFLNKEY